MMNYIYNLQLEQIYNDVLEMGELGFENASQKDIFYLRTMAKRRMLYNSLPDKARGFLDKLSSGSVGLILDYGIGRSKISYQDLIQEVTLNDFSPLESGNVEEKRELKNFRKFFKVADIRNEDYRNAEYIFHQSNQRLNGAPNDKGNSISGNDQMGFTAYVNSGSGKPSRQEEIINNEKENLNIDEVAVLLNLKKPTVYSKVCRGEIPGVSKPGKHLLFSKKVIKEWLESTRKKSNDEIKAEAHKYLVK